jgi:MFS family permease
MVAGNINDKGRLLFLNIILGALAMLVFAVSPWALLSYVAILVFGVTMGVWFVLVPTAIQTNVAPAVRGRAMSLFFMVALGLQTGWVVGGLLHEVTGTQLTAIIAAFGTAGIAATAFLRSSELRRLT